MTLARSLVPPLRRVKSSRSKNSVPLLASDTKPKTTPQPRTRRASSQFLRPQVPGGPSISEDKIPLLNEIATSGTSFKDKNALLTGVGKGSIGVEILKGLLSGGAHVAITASRYGRATVEYYQAIFRRNGNKGSALTVVPFNQASKQDVEALIDYIYTSLGMDLDYILPFAALPENGREIDGLDDKSDLAHRMMLVNILRLMGGVWEDAPDDVNLKILRITCQRNENILVTAGDFSSPKKNLPS